MPPDGGSNPALELLQLKEPGESLKEAAARINRKENELQLWKHWKAHGEQPEHLQPLLKLYDNVIAQKMKQKAPHIRPAAYRAELQKQVITAFKNYDPNRGTALNTHVVGRLPKALRYNNRHANLLYIPEGQSGKIGDINKAEEMLGEELGRKPTVQEVAHHLGMKPARVQTIIDAQQFTVPAGQSAGEEDYDYGSGSDATTHGFEDAQIAIAQNILPTLFPNKPEMHTLFGHVFGVNGHKQISSTSALAKKMGKSQSQISRMKTHMGTVLRSHMGLDDDDEVDDD